MWILSQSIGAISLVWWFITYQQKSKEKTLWMSSIAKGFGVATNLLLFNFIMAGLLLIRMPRDMTFAYLERRNKKGNPVKGWLSIGLFVLFCLLLIANTIFTTVFVYDGLLFDWALLIAWNSWFNWLLLAGALFVNFGKWKKGLAIFWTSVIIWSILAFVNALLYNNYTTMVTCVIVLTSLTINIVRHFKAKKKAELQAGLEGEKTEDEIAAENEHATIEEQSIGADESAKEL